MPKYHITTQYVTRLVTEIEAETPLEAINKYNQQKDILVTKTPLKEFEKAKEELISNLELDIFGADYNPFVEKVIREDENSIEVEFIPAHEVYGDDYNEDYDEEDD